MYRQFRSMVIPLLCAAVAVIGFLVAPVASAATHPVQTGPAARFASEATAYQNKVIEGALARVPNGIRISASQVRWPTERFGLGVPSSPDTEDNLLACLNAVTELDFCGFTAINYGGAYVYAWNSTTDLWVPWGALEPNHGMYSWYNAQGTRAWREQFQNHGNELCIDPWPYYGNYTNSSYSGANLNDYWVLLTTNEDRC